MSQAPRSGAYRRPWQGRDPEFYGASGGAPEPDYDEDTQHGSRASSYNADSRAQYPRRPRDPRGRDGRDPPARRDRDAAPRDGGIGRSRRPGDDEDRRGRGEDDNRRTYGGGPGGRRPGGDGQRSGRPPGGRPPVRWGSLSGRQGVAIVIGSAAVGAVGTMLTSGGPGTLLGVCLIAGTVAAGLAVRQPETYLIIPVPALAYLVAALVAGVAGSGAASHTALALDALQWIAHGFGTMLLATIIAIGITAARWWMTVQRAGAQRRPVPRRPTQRRSTGGSRQGGSGDRGQYGSRADPGSEPGYPGDSWDEPQPPDRTLLRPARR